MQGILLLSSAWAQEGSGEGSGEEGAEAEPEAEPEGEAEGDAEEASGDGEAAEEDEEDGEEGGEDEEECEEVESGDGGDDIEDILNPSGKKCKPKAEGGESSGDEPTGSEALAAEVNFPFWLAYNTSALRWEWKLVTKRAWIPRSQTALVA